MPLTQPTALCAAHYLDDFDCGKPSLNIWLVKYARQAQSAGSARTFIVADGSVVAGYFSLTAGQIESLEATERIRMGMGGYPIPVLVLARLAVDKKFQGRGVGTAMLRDAIRRTLTVSEVAGVRALLTHPIDEEATRFYLRFGFEPSPVREQQLLLLLKDAKKLLISTAQDSRL